MYQNRDQWSWQQSIGGHFLIPFVIALEILSLESISYPTISLMVSRILSCTKGNTRIVEYEIIMIFLLGPLFQKIYRDLDESDNCFDIIKDDENIYVNNVFQLVTSNGKKLRF